MGIMDWRSFDLRVEGNPRAGARGPRNPCQRAESVGHESRHCPPRHSRDPPRSREGRNAWGVPRDSHLPRKELAEARHSRRGKAASWSSAKASQPDHPSNEPTWEARAAMVGKQSRSPGLFFCATGWPSLAEQVVPSGGESRLGEDAMGAAAPHSSAFISGEGVRESRRAYRTGGKKWRGHSRQAREQVCGQWRNQGG